MQLSEEIMKKITLELDRDPVRVTGAMVTNPVDNPEENDYFSSRTDNIMADTEAAAAETDFIDFKNGMRVRCGYFNQFCTVDYAMDFSGISFEAEKRLFLYANIRCRQNKKVIVRLGGRNLRAKVWVNNTLIYNGSLVFIDLDYLLLELSAGDNLLFVELGRIIPAMPALKFSCRVSDYESDLNGDWSEILESFLENDVINQVQVIQEDWNIKKPFYEFMIIPKDFFTEIKGHNLHITLKDITGKIYDRFQVKLEERIRYDLRKLLKDRDENVFFKMEIEYETVNGRRILLRNILAVSEVVPALRKIREEYEVVRTNVDLNNNDQAAVENRIQEITDIYQRIVVGKGVTGTLLDLLIDRIEHISELFASFLQGLHYDYMLIKNRLNHIYYPSKLDGREEHFSILLPDGFSPQSKYPLMIYLPNDHYDETFLFSLKKYMTRDIILAEISCRGMTFGSYIGEATFLEVLELIRNRYNIDEDRIYLCGLCNGAFAAWGLAQIYPYLFAGLVVSAGGQYQKNLPNLKNIPIFNICGDINVKLDKFLATPSRLLQDADYTGIRVRDTSQDALEYIFSKTGFFVDWLLRHKREKYPAKIYFRTERSRHNRTYWLEIIRLEDGKKYCEVQGEIIDNSSLMVSLVNVKQCKLTIPAGINREEFRVTINKQHSFEFRTCKADYILFQKSGDGFSLPENRDLAHSGHSSLGMGILDIYMDSLKIVIPSEFGSAKEEKILKGVAEAFAKPFSSGIQPELYIHYPVMELAHFDTADTGNYNLIVIGSVWDSLLAKESNELPLEFDEEGYYYNGVYKKTAYCVIFIYPNPLNRDKRILLIYANNFMLYKNIFTRKIIVPTYFNGLHPFLNSTVLIFDGKTSYMIYASGDDIQRLW